MAIGLSRSTVMRKLPFQQLLGLFGKKGTPNALRIILFTDSSSWKRSKFSVATWISILPNFQDFSVCSIIRNWQEIAFSSGPRSFVRHTWSPPPSSFVKLNFDGSAIGNPGIIGLGGLLMNSRGDAILSFSGGVGFGSVNMAEMRALRIGLLVAHRLNLQRINLEGDLVCAIRWVDGQQVGAQPPGSWKMRWTK